MIDERRQPEPNLTNNLGPHVQRRECILPFFENQDALGRPLLLELAENLGISTQALDHALDDGEYAPRVKEDFLGGVRSGVNGTPTFFIDGVRYDGAFDFESLWQALAGSRGVELPGGA